MASSTFCCGSSFNRCSKLDSSCSVDGDEVNVSQLDDALISKLLLLIGVVSSSFLVAIATAASCSVFSIPNAESKSDLASEILPCD